MLPRILFAGVLLGVFWLPGGAAAARVAGGTPVPEKVIVGKWSIDIEETKKLLSDSEKKNLEGFGP
jgi:hypothetical protein